MLGYGLFTPASVYYANENVSPADRVRGQAIMMMASNVDNKEQIASEFDTAWKFFDEVKANYFANDPGFKERSWGMSDDYQIAVEHGSTMVRVGTKIFGPRVY